MRKKIFLFAASIAAASVFVSCLAVCVALYASGAASVSVFLTALPAVLIFTASAFVAAYVLAGGFTRRLARPINEARPGAPPYPELERFARVLRDLGEKSEVALAEEKERSEAAGAIVENMEEGAILLDGRGKLSYANKSAARIFGIPGGAAGRGKNPLEVLRDVVFSEKARDALRGERGELDISRGERIYRVIFSPAAGGAIILITDATEKARAERLRREFSANVSHELKTPLTGIAAAAEMLEGGMVKNADKIEFISGIKSEAARLSRLIDDIMLISRLDESGIGEDFKETDVAAAAREAAERLRGKADEGGVTLTVGTESVTARANPPLLSELFFNLIDNAVKYNRRGGMVAVTFDKKKDRAVVTVADTGIGIPEAARSRVFERFYRVDKSRSKKTGGTGLGLAIVKHIAAVHGAELFLDSAEGAGTKVTVIFPPVSA